MMMTLSIDSMTTIPCASAADATPIPATPSVAVDLTVLPHPALAEEQASFGGLADLVADNAALGEALQFLVDALDEPGVCGESGVFALPQPSEVTGGGFQLPRTTNATVEKTTIVEKAVGLPGVEVRPEEVVVENLLPAERPKLGAVEKPVAVEKPIVVKELVVRCEPGVFALPQPSETMTETVAPQPSGTAEGEFQPPRMTDAFVEKPVVVEKAVVAEPKPAREAVEGSVREVAHSADGRSGVQPIVDEVTTVVEKPVVADESVVRGEPGVFALPQPSVTKAETAASQPSETMTGVVAPQPSETVGGGFQPPRTTNATVEKTTIVDDETTVAVKPVVVVEAPAVAEQLVVRGEPGVFALPQPSVTKAETAASQPSETMTGVVAPQPSETVGGGFQPPRTTNATVEKTTIVEKAVVAESKPATEVVEGPAREVTRSTDVRPIVDDVTTVVEKPVVVVEAPVVAEQPVVRGEPGVFALPQPSETKAENAASQPSETMTGVVAPQPPETVGGGFQPPRTTNATVEKTTIVEKAVVAESKPAMEVVEGPAREVTRRTDVRPDVRPIVDDVTVVVEKPVVVDEPVVAEKPVVAVAELKSKSVADAPESAVLHAAPVIAAPVGNTAVPACEANVESVSAVSRVTPIDVSTMFLAAAEEVAAAVTVSPALMRGEAGEIRVQLRPDVLEGAEVVVAVDGKKMEVTFVPTVTHVADTLASNQVAMQQQLAARIPGFEVSVGVVQTVATNVAVNVGSERAAQLATDRMRKTNGRT